MQYVGAFSRWDKHMKKVASVIGALEGLTPDPHNWIRFDLVGV